MGLITPKKPLAQVKKVNKKFLDSSLADVAMKEISNTDGVQLTYAQALAQRIWNIALCGENDKDSITAAKFISERINGKPAVLKEEEKEEIPAIVFRVHAKDEEKIKELAERSDVEEEPQDRLVVDIEGEEGVREY